MQCIKTGCSAYLDPYGEWVYGDAFETKGGDLVIRIAGRSTDGPLNGRTVRHFTVLNADHWFDLENTSMAHNSTLIVDRGKFTNHGYDGVPENG